MRTYILAFPLAILLFSFTLISCANDDEGETNSVEDIQLPVEGSYSWEFEIPGAGSQVSTHDFDNDDITYTMVGDVYNVEYDMDILSYDDQLNKIIALGEEGSPKDGVYFAVFLKDITNTSVTIYKAELSSEDEAYELPIPADNDVQFHGWNTYEKD